MPSIAVLDNPVWYALTGPQASLARRVGNAARFDPRLSPFTAIADDDPRSWADLAELVGPGATAVLAAGPQTPPPGWIEKFRFRGLQMTGDDVLDLDDPELVELGEADAVEMRELAAQTRPGPFEERTHEFGGYLGVRRDGRLVAMAGQRIRPRGWTEISAVCTDQNVRGQGLASRLVRGVATAIRRRGDQPMLHVAESNEDAIRVYERLGFRTRGSVFFSGFAAPEQVRA
jgi:ribosomal protein S18 acetylase RimI-like enzyme